MFKKKETMRSENDGSESEQDSDKIISEKKKNARKSQIKRGYSKIQDQLQMLTNEMGIPPPKDMDTLSVTEKRATSVPGLKPKAFHGLEKIKRTAQKI